MSDHAPDPIESEIAAARARIEARDRENNQDRAYIADLEVLKRLSKSSPELLRAVGVPSHPEPPVAARTKLYGSKKRIILECVAGHGAVGATIQEVLQMAKAKGFLTATTEGVSPKLSFYKSEIGGGLVDLKNGRWLITQAGLKWLREGEKGPDHAA